MRKLVLLALFAGALWTAPVLAVETEPAAGEHETGDPHLWHKWINFAILAGGIGYLAVKVGGPAFRAKKHEIVDQLSEGTRRAEAAAAKAAEIDRRMAGLQQDVEALRAKAHTEMQAEAARLRQATVDQVAKIEAAAKLELASAAKSASQSLKASASELAIELARKKVAARMDDALQAKLVDRFSQQLGGGSQGLSN